jgi:hypothetical protein
MPSPRLAIKPRSTALSIFDFRRRTAHRLTVTQNDLKEFIRNSAAKPIRVSLVDGVSYKISHPDFAFATSESLIIAAGPDNQIEGEFVVCPLHHISRIEVMKRRAKSPPVK